MMAVLESDGVVVEVGDMLCLYTGFADAISDGPAQGLFGPQRS
jgi:hypothetical protein